MRRAAGAPLLALVALLFAVAAFGQSTALTDPLAEALRERVDHLRYDARHDVRGARIVLHEGVSHFYETRQFAAAWTELARVDRLIDSIAGLYSDGLDPRDYHLEALRAVRRELGPGRRLEPRDQAEFELIATDAMLLALYHLYAGKVDPERLSSQWNYPPRPMHEQDGLVRLSAAVDSGRIREAFAETRPQHPWYQRGRERLEQYRAIEAAGGWPSLPEGPVLKPGMSDPRVPTLRRRLEITADLPTAAPAPATPDLYDAPLEAAVRGFQERHGLAADGAVGPGTRAALNVPVARRIDQIRVNLERGRWVLHEVHGEFVLVDVAGFYVAYYRNDEPVWTSRVVVGKPYRETPIFKSLITYVVFNPTWTIPPTILAEDKLPVIRRNPGYLQRNNIRVVDGSGRSVNPYSVDWSRYGKGRLPPYQFVQEPGPANALGLVKIMFPNPHLVYLHDTPSKSLFEQDQRTFSSGCIRVQKAFELAELVLADPVNWNRASIDAVIASKRMQTVNLAKPIPVLLLYWTAQPTADGQVTFRNDVYGRDPPILEALDSDFAQPAAAVRGGS